MTRKDKKLRIFKSGRYVQVWTKCGVQVNFDGRHAVSVAVPKTYSDSITGLCGNCNGDKNDDYRTKDGKDKRKDKDKYSSIGDSYLVKDPESDLKMYAVIPFFYLEMHIK